MPDPITRAAIEATAEKIAPYVRRTPVMDVMLSGIATPVALKLELFQHTGSFKARGAFSTVIGRDIPKAGLAAASGGNHGAAAAYAAHVAGVPAHIFVPAIAAPAKVQRIKSYGAVIEQDGATYYDALENCNRFIAASGALSVHAYDAVPTLLGQGTLGREIQQQLPYIDTLLVAVGGGGLIGGIAGWYRGDVRIIGVEPETCNALHASLAAGARVTVKPSGVAADSLGASFAGELMFPLAQKFIERVALVDDEEIRMAQRWLWDHARIITEPGGATAFAALLSGAYRPQKDERVCVILCGSNTDPETFSRVMIT
ncbi:threonine/serine dehydratase [Taklimakanibacter deserti]|uniref:threonine/serine dehydratase n=1 Tax=Taklimakanibacter deserti TaxID=2267839 RepID=UPI000E655CE2